MRLQKNISLKPYNTFGISARASAFVSIDTVAQLREALLSTSKNILILGGGSNILLTKDYFDDLIIHINNKGIKIIKELSDRVIVRAYSGEQWDDFVKWSVTRNLGGLENLALIPGKVGATPIQNIGAYGQEIKDVMQSCQVMDRSSLDIRTYENKDCNFGYRDSIFKHERKNKDIIISVDFILKKQSHELKLNYGSIKETLYNQGIKKPNILDVMNVVTYIRQSKLPNPKDIGNAGSFFKNPIISKDTLNHLISKTPQLPNYKVNDNLYKIPAGWLIDQVGFKGKKIGNVGIYDKQALVLTNCNKANGQEILEVSHTIEKEVYRLFHIKMESEVTVF